MHVAPGILLTPPESSKFLKKTLAKDEIGVALLVVAENGVNSAMSGIKSGGRSFRSNAAPRGMYPGRLDDSGRVKLPAKFQQYLAALPEKTLFVTSLDRR